MVVGLFVLSTAFAIDEGFSYSSQDHWTGVCVTGNTGRQSPINIITQDVQFDGSLIDMEMTGWDVAYNGTFSNQGHNVVFFPSNPQATTRNHLGTYDLLQCHFHWGNQTGEGSEHLVNSDVGELEIHFVQRKQEATEMYTRSGDYLTVISVIVEVDEEAELTGPWQLLDASRVAAPNDTIPVTGFRFDQFLPSNRDYYFYEGSLSTPPCFEIVGWFVMKDRITVPGAYLEQLRNVQLNDGDKFNFRQPQEIGNRVVTTNSKADFVKPVVYLLMLGVVLSVLPI